MRLSKLQNPLLLLSLVFFSSVFVACSNSATYVDYINVLGVVVDQQNAPLENATVVVFLDGIEIARVTTFPLRASISSCDSKMLDSKYIGSYCNNFEFKIPRVAEFEMNQGEFTANARLLQHDKQLSFRSLDGRFLVIKALSTTPARSILMLQPDDTIITPSAGTAVYTPTFSPKLAPTQAPSTASSSTASSVTGDFLHDWVRPLLIGAVISFIPTLLTLFVFQSQRKNQPLTKRTSSQFTPVKKNSERTIADELKIAIFVQVVSSILTAIVIKWLGL